MARSRQPVAAHKDPRRVECVADFPLGPSGEVSERDLNARFTERI